MIVVETRTSASPRRNAASGPRAPSRASARTIMRRSRRAPAATRPARRSSRRGCGGRTPVRRARPPAQGLLDQLLVELADVRPDRAPALGRCLDDRDVPQAGERHVECAQDRRRGEREDVDLKAQLAQQLLLRDAEALLLVHDHEPEVLRDHVSREHPVRPDEDVHLSLCELGEHLLRLLGAAESARPSRRSAGSRDSARGRCSSAAGRARSSGRASGSACRSARRRSRLEQRPPSCRTQRPRRRAGPSAGVFRVFLDCLDRHPLVVGLLVGEARLELLQVLVLEVVRDPRRLLSLGVEAERLAGELADALPRPALEQLPRLAAELRERRRAPPFAPM